MKKWQIIIEVTLAIAGLIIGLIGITHYYYGYNLIVDKVVGLVFLLMPLLSLTVIYAYIKEFYKHDETKNLLGIILMVAFAIYVIISHKHGY